MPDGASRRPRTTSGAPTSIEERTHPSLAVETTTRDGASGFLSTLVRDYLADGLGLGTDHAAGVPLRLAVTEALTNVVRHAYPEGRTGPIRLELFVEKGSLVVRLQDHGPCFDPRTSTADLPSPEELAEGGYGIPILRQVMDSIDHSWTEQSGNVLTLRKRLP